MAVSDKNYNIEEQHPETLIAMSVHKMVKNSERMALAMEGILRHLDKLSSPPLSLPLMHDRDRANPKIRPLVHTD